MSNLSKFNAAFNNFFENFEIVDVETVWETIKADKKTFIRDMKEAAVITIINAVIVLISAIIFYLICSKIFM